MYRLLTPSIINNMQAQTITLPLNLYLELCKQRDGHDDKMDEFLMYTYKVKRCPRMRAHDWTECPYAHRGEKARRRDPKKFPYQGVVCPEFKDGECKRGNNCEFAHGVFEFWLHPSRFRTRICESGVLCPRKVCFFAHMPEQLRPERVHHCSRCKRPADPSSVVVADAVEDATTYAEGDVAADAERSADGGREKAAIVATEATLAAVSSSSGGGEGSMIRVRDALEQYNDFDHLEWVVDLVNF